MKIPGDIWTVENWTVKTGVGLRLGLGFLLGLDLGLGLVLGFELVFRLGLVMTVQMKMGNHGTTTPHFLADVCCRQTAGWIKMPFGMAVCVGPDHIVLNGNPAPPIRDTAAPKFRPVSIVAKWLHGSKCHLVRR